MGVFLHNAQSFNTLLVICDLFSEPLLHYNIKKLKRNQTFNELIRTHAEQAASCETKV